MKKYFKETWVSYLIAIVISFMLFIFEPINMYSSNINDFWFDFNILIKPSIIVFLISTIGIILVMNILYFINKKLFKISNIILFIGFLCTYIQGNYLVGNLPVLDGTPIDWSKYIVDNIITVVMWLIVIIISIILCKKYKISNYIKYSGYVTLAIFAMLNISLITTFATKDVFKSKYFDVISTSTIKNINKYSNNKNFIIFLLDAVDSKYFSDSLNSINEYSDTFKDFTYYPDTMSIHPFTQESIPLILTGKVFENQEPYLDYSNKAMKESSLFNELYNNNYEVNVYEKSFNFYDKDALKIANIVNTAEDKDQINTLKFIKEESKYSLFRYLPFFIKKYSKIETLDFNITKKVLSDGDYYSDDNMKFLNEIKKGITKDPNNNFKFIHLDGAHVPFNFDKDLNLKKNASYKDEVEGCLNLTNQYFQILKENDVYDNSVIIVMADHGFAMESDFKTTFEGRQNPILFIKGYKEKHDEMIISDKKISYVDLKDAYKDLLENKKSNDLFLNINSNRTRRYLFYVYSNEKHMIEYETNDKAWETNKMYKTGKEFNLKK